METNLYGDEWGWNGSSVGMGGDGSETGWGQVAMGIKSVGIGVISVPVQVSSRNQSIPDATLLKSSSTRYLAVS